MQSTSVLSLQNVSDGVRRNGLSDEQREEKNRKRREYRVRKKVESNSVDGLATSGTPMQMAIASFSQLEDSGSVRRSIMSDKQREKKNRKQREYRTIKKAELGDVTRADETTTTIVDGSPYGTAYSTILQAPGVTDKENIDPYDTMDWLRRNDIYKQQSRKRKMVDFERDPDSHVLEDGVTQEENCICARCS